jgi:hypothetical protein
MDSHFFLMCTVIPYVNNPLRNGSRTTLPPCFNRLKIWRFVHKIVSLCELGVFDFCGVARLNCTISQRYGCDRNWEKHCGSNDFLDPDSVLMVNLKFVECATRQAAQSVGHKLRSCTTDIRTVRITHPDDGRPLLLVDTPGFDDTVKSDVEILIMIADYLVKMCAI